MVQINGVYQGEKHCEMVHEPSGSILETDAPRDNQGRGEKFSPTDLLGAALGSCMVTTMAILTESEGLNLNGSTFQVQKIMAANPRRVSALNFELHLPKNLSPSNRLRLEEIARQCPVYRTLNPELRIHLIFHYDLIQ